MIKRMLNGFLGISIRLLGSPVLTPILATSPRQIADSLLNQQCTPWPAEVDQTTYNKSTRALSRGFATRLAAEAIMYSLQY